MHPLLRSISHKLRIPAVCILCDQYHKDHVAVCNACADLLTPVGNACYHCALPLPESDFLVCGHCCKTKPYIDQATAACLYEEPLRTLLHEFKYQEELYLCSFLANLMRKAIPADGLKTECLIPIPIHPKRLRQRGYNQAAELTKQLSKILKRPYSLSMCTKIVNTIPQAGLTAKQRQLNIRNTFSAKSIPFQHITLIDDLLTTGSTANELAKTFKKQGVRRVDVWCCAKVSESGNLIHNTVSHHSR